MLFFINKSNPSLLKRLALVGGDEDKILVLVGDGAVFASEFWQEQFENLAVEEIYAESGAVQARNIVPAAACKIVTYDEIAEMLFESEQVVSL